MAIGRTYRWKSPPLCGIAALAMTGVSEMDLDEYALLDATDLARLVRNR
jgi:hypothetical protein